MEPNSDQATALLAHIAAVEGRPATSAALTNGSVPAQFPDFWSLKRYDYLSASTIKLASHDNIFCSTASGGHDEAYFDGDILFIPVRDL
jgi:hypothetical protein